MSNSIQSLISYGEKVQLGSISNNEKEITKLRAEELDENDPISLKSYLDSILPPKETSENGQINMQFVSCDSAIVGDVIKLSKDLENQLKIRNAKETGICTIREELYAECLDELIRQVTISCLQRGELLNRVKLEMKETISYYQKLYESAISCAIRRVLIEGKKKKKLEMKEQRLQNEIENLKMTIAEKERELEEKNRNEEEKEKLAKEDHEEAMKNLKNDNQMKEEKLKKILTTPKQAPTIKK